MRMSVRRLSQVLVLCVFAACDSPTSESDGRWELVERDDVFGGPFARASQLQRGMGLHVRCEAGRYWVHVSTTFFTGSDTIRYRFDGQPLRSERWLDASGFQALVHPGDARAFAGQIAAARTMSVEVQEQNGPRQRRDFDAAGLAEHLPRIDAACAL